MGDLKGKGKEKKSKNSYELATFLTDFWDTTTHFLTLGCPNLCFNFVVQWTVMYSVQPTVRHRNWAIDTHQVDCLPFYSESVGFLLP